MILSPINVQGRANGLDMTHGFLMTKSCRGSLTQTVCASFCPGCWWQAVLVLCYPNYLHILVTISEIGYSRATGVDTWITSDGRAYIAQLIDPTLNPPSLSDLGTVDDEALQVSHFFSAFRA